MGRERGPSGLVEVRRQPNLYPEEPLPLDPPPFPLQRMEIGNLLRLPDGKRPSSRLATPVIRYHPAGLGLPGGCHVDQVHPGEIFLPWSRPPFFSSPSLSKRGVLFLSLFPLLPPRASPPKPRSAGKGRGVWKRGRVLLNGRFSFSTFTLRFNTPSRFLMRDAARRCR